jgi:hypothetical protein
MSKKWMKLNYQAGKRMEFHIGRREKNTLKDFEMRQNLEEEAWVDRDVGTKGIKPHGQGKETYRRVYSKVSGLSHTEIYNSKDKQSSRSNTKGYGGKSH